MSDEKFRHESLQDKESIGKYLTALSAGFAEGRLQFSWKDRRLVLEPDNLIKFDLEARKQDGEVRMTLGFRWEEPSEESIFVDSPLVIGAGDKG